MGDSALDGEEIIRRYVQPALKSARNAAASARGAAPGDPSSALVLISVLLLEHFTNKLIARMRDQDIAERIAVYHLIAETCAKPLGQPASLVFPAVLRLCGGTDDEELTRELQEPDRAILDSLNAVLLQVTVEYNAQAGKGADRIVEVYVHEGGEPPVTKTEMRTRLRWDATPEDVRGQAIKEERGRQATVSFTLYPGGNA
jgi:hypothetical protein